MGKVVFLAVLLACNKLCDAVIIAQNEIERESVLMLIPDAMGTSDSIRANCCVCFVCDVCV